MWRSFSTRRLHRPARPPWSSALSLERLMMEAAAPVAVRTTPAQHAIEVSIVMPCLNEADTVATCIQKAQRALRDAGMSGEVIVADNGSTDPDGT